MAAQDTRPHQKKGKVGRPAAHSVQHVIEIENWQWDYMFGIDTTRFRDGPYFDFRHLVITGKLLRPTSITAADGVEVTCLPDHRLSESESRSSHKPRAVGGISHRGKSYSANLHLPSDALAPVLQMMIAGKYRYVVIEAEKSYRGEALVRHFRFAGAIGDEELT